MENSAKKINMVLYFLEEEDVKTPIQKFDIIPNKLYIIGRSKKDCNIVLNEKLLSRKQAELIYYDNEKIMIKDLDTKNGTYINKERIEPFKEIYFTMRDILSFGGIKNEIIFCDKSEEKDNKKKYLDDYKQSQSKKDNDKIEKSSYSRKDTNYYRERYNNSKYEKREKLSYNSNDKYLNKNRFSKNSSKSRSRDRYSHSREKYREKSKHYSNRDNSYKKSLRSSKDIIFQRKDFDDKSFENYSKEKKIYYKRQLSLTEEEKFKEENISRYRNTFDDNGKNEFDINSRDIGFIKCQVNGYLVLNIRK